LHLLFSVSRTFCTRVSTSFSTCVIISTLLLYSHLDLLSTYSLPFYSSYAPLRYDRLLSLPTLRCTSSLARYETTSTTLSQLSNLRRLLLFMISTLRYYCYATRRLARRLPPFPIATTSARGRYFTNSTFLYSLSLSTSLCPVYLGLPVLYYSATTWLYLHTSSLLTLILLVYLYFLLLYSADISSLSLLSTSTSLLSSTFSSSNFLFPLYSISTSHSYALRLYSSLFFSPALSLSRTFSYLYFN